MQARHNFRNVLILSRNAGLRNDIQAKFRTQQVRVLKSTGLAAVALEDLLENRQRCDLVITEVELNDGSVLKLMNELRSREAFGATHVVLMYGSAEEELLPQLLPFGLSGMLRMPFSIEEMSRYLAIQSARIAELQNNLTAIANDTAGRYFEEIKQYQLAVRYYQEAADAEPNSGSHFEAGRLLLKLGAEEEAKNEFNAALKIDKRYAKEIAKALVDVASTKAKSKEIPAGALKAFGMELAENSRGFYGQDQLRRAIVLGGSHNERITIKGLLRELGIQNVQLEDSGQQTLAILQREQVDLVIVNIRISDMNGLQFLDAVQQQQYEQAVYCVLMLEEELSSNIPPALEHGADGFLLKPFTKVKIMTCLHESILQRHMTITAPKAGKALRASYQLVLQENEMAAASQLALAQAAGDGGAVGELFAAMVEHLWGSALRAGELYAEASRQHPAMAPTCRQVFARMEKIKAGLPPRPPAQHEEPQGDPETIGEGRELAEHEEGAAGAGFEAGLTDGIDGAEVSAAAPMLAADRLVPAEEHSDLTNPATFTAADIAPAAGEDDPFALRSDNMIQSPDNFEARSAAVPAAAGPQSPQIRSDLQLAAPTAAEAAGAGFIAAEVTKAPAAASSPQLQQAEAATAAAAAAPVIRKIELQQGGDPFEATEAPLGRSQDALPAEPLELPADLPGRSQPHQPNVAPPELVSGLPPEESPPPAEIAYAEVSTGSQFWREEVPTAPLLDAKQQESSGGGLADPASGKSDIIDWAPNLKLRRATQELERLSISRNELARSQKTAAVEDELQEQVGMPFRAAAGDLLSQARLFNDRLAHQDPAQATVATQAYLEALGRAAADSEFEEQLLKKEAPIPREVSKALKRARSRDEGDAYEDAGRALIQSHTADKALQLAHSMIASPKAAAAESGYALRPVVNFAEQLHKPALALHEELQRRRKQFKDKIPYFLSELREKPRESATILKRAMEIDSNSFAAFKMLHHELDQAGLTSAKKVLLKEMELRAFRDLEFGNRLGRFLMNEENWDEAQRILRNVSSNRNDPQRLQNFYHIARIAYRKGAFKESIKWCKRMFALSRHSVEAYNLLGASYRQLGKLRRAIRAYKVGLKHHPDAYKLNHNLSLALARNDEDEEAEKYRQLAQEIKKQIKAENSDVSVDL